MSTIPVFPPIDGSLTVPQTIDFHVQHNPQEPIFVFHDAQAEDGIKNITYKEFAQACDKVAHYIRPQPSVGDRQVVAVILLTDTLLYQTIVVGIMRAGFVPFPISPRNSPQAVLNLLKVTSCHTLLTTRETLSDLLQSLDKEIEAGNEQWPLQILDAPGIATIFPSLGGNQEPEDYTPYPMPLDHINLDEPALYLHSSGSTGLPKSICQTHRMLVQWAAYVIPTMRIHIPRFRLAAMALPSFHTLGIYKQLLQPLYGCHSIALYPPTVFTPTALPTVPTSDNILEHMKHTKSNGLVIMPAILHQWAQSQEAVDYLKTMGFVAYAGGPLTERVGNALAEAGVNVKSIYGATEFGAPSLPELERGQEKDWEWIKFSDNITINWVDQGNGTYECQLLRSDHLHPAVENMVDPRGYSTSDTFIPHPTKPNLWKIVGRSDDVIIHSSGEKTVPAPLERIITSSPLVQSALMFGRNHDQSGVLIEPQGEQPTNDDELVEFRNRLWPVIEEANRNAPAFSRIFKEMIILTSPEKPIPRSPKGTVMRKAALEVYKEEIEELYKSVESSSGGANVKPPQDWQLETVKAWLEEQTSDIQSGRKLLSTQDLFEQGFDSLSATFLRLRIVSALRASANLAKAADAVSQNTIYTYPTLDALAAFMVNLAAHPQEAQVGTGHKEAIEEMIAKYSVPVVSKKDNEGGKVFLLTGTTGNLASQILADLLTKKETRYVYALNRRGRESLEERHRARFVDKALDVELLKSPKLRLIAGDASEDQLGLDKQLYDELKASVNVIIHSAWRLDFNLTLSSFEPHIRGTRNLIDLALEGPHAADLRFLFTSSIGSAQSWDQSQGFYPEHVLEDPKYCIGNGYGEGKYVSERILQRSGLQASSLRVGQLSGGLPNGAWATTDWFPILVKSSIALKSFPTAPGVISWLPMHAAAQSIVDLSFSEEKLPFALNLVHPRPVPWTPVIETVRDAVVRELRSDKETLPLIPFSEWLQRLEEVAKEPKSGDLENIPAIKLLDFFRGVAKGVEFIKANDHAKDMETLGLTRFSTDKAQAVSETMRNAQSLNDDDAISWVTYWRGTGFL